MPPTLVFVLGYLGLINLITFIYFGVDKHKARKGLRRIPEKRLHFCALLGGVVGGIAGMSLFHHKTRKPSFLAVYALASLVPIALTILGALYLL